MVSSLRDDDPSAAWDGDSRLKPRCSHRGQTAGGDRVGSGQYSARTRPYFVGYPNFILPDPGTATRYMAPTRGLDLAASSTNAFISSGMEIFMVALKTTSSLRIMAFLASLPTRVEQTGTSLFVGETT